MKITKSSSIRSLGVALSLLSALSPYFLVASEVKATAPTVAYVRFDRLEASAALSGTVCLNTTTSGTEAKIALTLPSTFTTSTTTSDWTTSTTNLPDGATAWPSIGSTASTAVGATGGVITFASGNLSASTLYCFNFAGANSTRNNAAASNQTGSFATLTSGDAAIDTIDYATATTATGGDQISVTATVPTTFSFSLSGSSAALGTLSTSSVVSATGVTATVGTNARNGWLAWVKNSSNGLYSSTAATSIANGGSYGSIYDLTSTTGYGLDVNTGAGTPTIDAAYDGSGDTNNIGLLDSTFKQIATKSSPASADTVVLRFRSKISATQPAATDYTDTVTVTASGNF